jgi:hypothetical protein
MSKSLYVARLMLCSLISDVTATVFLLGIKNVILPNLWVAWAFVFLGTTYMLRATAMNIWDTDPLATLLQRRRRKKAE